MRLVLALDAGTSSVRALSFREDLTVVDVAQLPLTQHFPSPGEVEHDVTEITALAARVLDDVAGRARARGDEIVALGLTNQRETTVAFDRAGAPPRHRALVWQDRRTAPECAQLAADGHLARVRATTGLVLDPYFSGTKMRWLIDHGALDGARHPAVATIDSYLLWWLTGATVDSSFVTEPSNASRTMLYDLHDGSWSVDMSELLGVETTLLATVCSSAGSFGAVSSRAVPALDGVPITGVLGDQQAALLGQGCITEGLVKATYGTGAFVLVHAGARVPEAPDGLLATVAWDLGDRGGRAFALEGAAFVAGAAIQWLRDELGLIATAEDAGPLAATVADAGGVAFVPAFSGLGSPFWRSDARGALLGLTRGSTAAHITRAVIDAQAFQVKAITDAFAESGVVLSAVRADGGLAAVDEMLALQATLSRVPVERSASLEATARGAAVIAGVGAGIWDVDHAADTWRGDLTVSPGDAAGPDLAYAAWRRAVERA